MMLEVNSWIYCKLQSILRLQLISKICISFVMFILLVSDRNRSIS